MKNISKFDHFISEATLRGNTGFPGETPSNDKNQDIYNTSGGEGNFIDAILTANQEEAQRMRREIPQDISNLMGNAIEAQEMQRGHEQELSDLAVEVIRQVYGTFLDDVILDLKIVTRPDQSLRDKMEKCKNCQLPNFVELEDQEIIDEINRRKIIRTVQQGKGLNVKEIINLPMVSKRLKQILGENEGEEYRRLANKIAAGAHFYDLTLTPAQKSSMFRDAPPGACDIDIEKPKTKDEQEEEKEINPEDLLDDIQKDGEINPDMAQALEGTQSTVIARALDFGLLIHESVKGVYKLITQTLLMQVGDTLGLEAADIVKANTETMMDEIEEQAIGKNLQKILGIVINTNSRAESIINNLSSKDDYEGLAAFTEQLHWLFYGKLAQITPAKRFLELINSVLSQCFNPDGNTLKPISEIGRNMNRRDIDTIINQCLDDMDAEREYQDWKKKYGGSQDNPPSGGIDGPSRFGGPSGFGDFGGFGLN
jgi:hypothetical protein